MSDEPQISPELEQRLKDRFAAHLSDSAYVADVVRAKSGPYKYAVVGCGLLGAILGSLAYKKGGANVNKFLIAAAAAGLLWFFTKPRGAGGFASGQVIEHPQQMWPSNEQLQAHAAYLGLTPDQYKIMPINIRQANAKNAIVIN